MLGGGKAPGGKLTPLVGLGSYALAWLRDCVLKGGKHLGELTRLIGGVSMGFVLGGGAWDTHNGKDPPEGPRLPPTMPRPAHKLPKTARNPQEWGALVVDEGHRLKNKQASLGGVGDIVCWGVSFWEGVWVGGRGEAGGLGVFAWGLFACLGTAQAGAGGASGVLTKRVRVGDGLAGGGGIGGWPPIPPPGWGSEGLGRD